MGYDLYGKAPTSSVGEHFRRNIRGWPPLVELLYGQAYWQARRCKDWYGANTGHGLSAVNAEKLADVLEKRLRSGRISAFMDRLSSACLGYRTYCKESDVEAFIAFLKACGGFEIM